MSDTLFDPDIYGPGSKKRTATRERSSSRASLPVEPHEEPWELIRQRDGVAPFFHVPLSTNPLGATVTACGLQGNAITNAGVAQMIRCPVCVVALEMR